MTTNLQDRAVLVKFTDHCWVGGIINKTATKKVETDAGATSGTGHYWQRLVPKAALKERVNFGSDARTYHNNQTLPWLGGGVRILPSANLDEYLKGMRKRQAAAEAAVKKFCDDYSQWIDEARRTQGALFDPKHYPTVDEVRSKFGFDIDIMPLPSIADWRVNVSEEQAAELRKEAELKMTQIQEEGIRELYSRLQEVLTHAKERLDDPEKTFRDSLIGNIKSMVDLIAKLNVTGNPELEAIRQETEEKLAGLGPNTLRTDPEARRKAAKATSDIISKMSAYMGGAKIAIRTTPAPAPDLDVAKREKRNAAARARRIKARLAKQTAQPQA